MILKLPNGLILDGTIEQVSAAAKAMGYNSVMDETLYHYSDSKGQFIRITQMDTKYIANALYKIYRDFSKGKFLDGIVFAEELVSPHFKALLDEYESRTDR